MVASILGIFFFALSEFKIFMEIFNKVFHLKENESKLLFNINNNRAKIDLSKFKQAV